VIEQIELRGDWVQVMLAMVQSRTFCLLICCLKKEKTRIYKTIILCVVLYVCETWSLTLRQEHRLRMFENGAEETIWIEEGWSDRRLQKAA
jgi:hypothetical protein